MRYRWLAAGVAVAAIVAVGTTWGIAHAERSAAEERFKVAADRVVTAAAEQDAAANSRTITRKAAAAALAEHEARAGAVELLGDGAASVTSAAELVAGVLERTHQVPVWRVFVPDSPGGGVDELTALMIEKTRQLRARTQEFTNDTGALQSAVDALGVVWADAAPVPAAVTPALVEGTPEVEAAAAVAAADRVGQLPTELSPDSTQVWVDWVASVTAARAAKAAADETARLAAEAEAAARAQQQAQSGGNRGNTGGSRSNNSGGTSGGGGSSNTGGGMGWTPREPCADCLGGKDPAV